MNEKGHVVNAVLLSVGIGIILNIEQGTFDMIPITTAKYGVPILFGALFPDIDTTFGTHRQTFHNLLVLVAVVGFALFFDNMHFVWIGVVTHYTLDLMGNVKGMAVFYPHTAMYDIPVGVPVDSRWADLVTLIVTGVELAVIYVLVVMAPELPFVDTLRHLLGA